MKITGQDKKIIRRLGIARLSATVIFVILLFLCIALNAGKLDIYLPEDCRVSDFVPETNIVSVCTAPDSENHMIVIAEGHGKVFIDNVTGNGSCDFEYVNRLPRKLVKINFCQLNFHSPLSKKLTCIKASIRRYQRS